MARERAVDVLIIGGGPAGTAAAAELARSGIAAVVLTCDEAIPPVRGELVSPAAVAVLDRLGATAAVRALRSSSPATATVVSSRDGRHRSTWGFANRPGVPARGIFVDRGELEGALRAHAAAAGAEVLSGWKATHLEWESNRLTAVQASDAQGRDWRFTCRAVLDASGRATFIADRMGWRFPLPVLGYRATSVIANSSTQNERGTDRFARLVWTDGGWLWLIPLGDSRVAVTGVWVREHQNPGADWLSHAATAPAVADLVDPRSIGTAPALQRICHRVMNLAGPGVGLIGDAAGFVDPFFATGLVVALAAGESAAADVRDGLLSRGRVEGDDLAPTVTLIRAMHRATFRATRALQSRTFRRLLTSPPRLPLIVSSLGALFAGDIVRPGRTLRFAGVPVLVALAALARVRPGWRYRFVRAGNRGKRG